MCVNFSALSSKTILLDFSIENGNGILRFYLVTVKSRPYGISFTVFSVRVFFKPDSLSKRAVCSMGQAARQKYTLTSNWGAGGKKKRSYWMDGQCLPNNPDTIRRGPPGIVIPIGFELVMQSHTWSGLGGSTRIPGDGTAAVAVIPHASERSVGHAGLAIVLVDM
jgi:hypothetical protein